MRTHGAFRLCAHCYAELDQAAFPLTQRPGVVLGGAQSVKGFLHRREATLEVLVDLRQVLCHALLLRQTTAGVSHATSREALRSSKNGSRKGSFTGTISTPVIRTLPPRICSPAEGRSELRSLEGEVAFEQIVTMGLAAATGEARKHVPGRKGRFEIVPQPEAPLAHAGRVGGEETVEVAGDGKADPALGRVRGIFR